MATKRDEAESKRAAETVGEALIEAMASRLHRDMTSEELQALLESCRDTLVDRFGFTPRSAANLTRMVLQNAACRRGSRARLWSDEEFEVMRALVEADL